MAMRREGSGEVGVAGLDQDGLKGLRRGGEPWPGHPQCAGAFGESEKGSISSRGCNSTC